MRMRHMALGVLISSLLSSLLILFSLPVFAAPIQQADPPAQGKTTVVANLRSGPGSNFAKVGSLPAGQTVSIAGCNAACDWYQLDSGVWIAAFLIEPVADEAASSTPAPTLRATAAATGTAAIALPTPTRIPPAAPASTPTTEENGTSASSNGNLRSGPGTDYARVGSVQAGQSLQITGKNNAGDWFQLVDGNWIAAFLVVNSPVDIAVVDAPTPPVVQATPVAPAAPEGADQSAAAPTDDLQRATAKWQERVDFNTVYTCGHFEYRLTDIRRKKSVWFFNSEYVAQGEWLMVFLEVKNISPGTSHFGAFSPRLIVLTTDGRTASSTGDFKASGYASWMFQHGRFYEDINPGKTLGLVEAYDLPLEPDLILGFSLLDCPDDLLSLGMWSNVPQSTK